jgi:hypothetical protein
VAVGGVGGHLAWVCAWRDGDGVSLDLRHFAIALRLASRRPAHTGHSVDTTAFVDTTAADLCRRYSGQPAFEFVADGHDVGAAWQGSGAQAGDDFAGVFAHGGRLSRNLSVLAKGSGAGVISCNGGL